ncbi:MAG: bifunctional lysylphosphatidylglycerol flippase/synthetase MprF [Proteobacteria bacterium]|nr:bifunctional lysylphosphatidylglycerol flippase/synthetase MprF [Pseudomonadota bacterium]
MNSNARPHRVPAWTTWLGIVLFLLAFLWLRHVLAQYHLRTILSGFLSLHPDALVLAGVLTFCGYTCLTLYEVLGLRFAGVRLPYPRIAVTAFVAYAIGHNVGLNALSGGAIRYRAYSAAGLSATQIGKVIAFGSLTFGLGAALLVGVSLLSQAGVSGSVLHVRESLAQGAGVVLLVLVAGYFVLTFLRDQPLVLGRFRLPIPSPRIALAQIIVACSDLLLAASVLYVLLPMQAHISFLAFAGLFLVAVAAGVVTNVPAGLGVFESVMILLLPVVAPDRLLVSMLGYRFIYYLVPFGIALALLAAHEIWLHRVMLRRVARLAQSWLAAVTPQATAIAVFAAGAVLLFSSATPGLEERLVTLRQVVPLPILEASHLIGSAVGVALLILANGLYRRLDGAWWIAVWLLGFGAVVSLLKGIDYEEATILGVVDGLLILAHARFNRRASLIDQRFSGPWILAVLLVLGVSLWLVVLAYRHVPYANSLWSQYAFEASAPRSLRALLVAALLAGAYGLSRLLRPATPQFNELTDEDYARAGKLIAECPDTTANLALLGDKNLLFDEAGTAFIMYEVSGSSWVAMGDPVGSPVACENLAWEFFERCDRVAASPVFYQVSADNLALYVDLGLSLIKLGEEARVELAGFSLEGGARADLRQTHRRALRDGARFEIIPRAQLAPLLPQLREVSDAWLTERKTAEKGFSLGFFDEAYLSRFDCAVVRNEQRIVAFANIWKAGGLQELSVDLMRHRDGAPKGVIDYLFIEIMLWGKAQGFKWFNLGMAPLSGLETHPLAPAWHKVGRLLQRYGENFYNFEGLRKYKDKYLPVWRPRYMAAPRGISMAGALLDVTSLISGGVTKALRK